MEVVIALGVISFAAVAVLGLLPTGLSTLRDSVDQSRQTQILRSVAGRAEVTKFSLLATDGLFFDREGLPVDNADLAAYTVNIHTGPSVYPGSSNAVDLGKSLTALRIEIIWKPFPEAPGRTNAYSLQVSNDGK